MRVVTAHHDGGGLHVRTIGMRLVGIEVTCLLLNLVKVRGLLIVIHYHRSTSGRLHSKNLGE